MGRGMGGEGPMNYVMKLTGAESGFGAEEWTKIVTQKLKEFLAVLEHFGKMFMAKVDEVFPPGTRVGQLKHWAQVAAPYIIAAAAFWILFRCFRRCCCRGRGGLPKMMIAPGTGRAFKIPRPSFEASPRLYFRSLRLK